MEDPKTIVSFFTNVALHCLVRRHLPIDVMALVASGYPRLLEFPKSFGDLLNKIAHEYRSSELRDVLRGVFRQLVASDRDYCSVLAHIGAINSNAQWAKISAYIFVGIERAEEILKTRGPYRNSTWDLPAPLVANELISRGQKAYRGLDCLTAHKAWASLFSLWRLFKRELDFSSELQVELIYYVYEETRFVTRDFLGFCDSQYRQLVIPCSSVTSDAADEFSSCTTRTIKIGTYQEPINVPNQLDGSCSSLLIGYEFYEGLSGLRQIIQF
ncbi:MAG: hypothetical protein IT291_10795 [Deltaproteobacteria bacterium]|nr:hypothetical protein [Deltaproteobacteria bacterium]